MPKPTTLRNLVGLPDAPPPLADSALVLIDCQNTYRQGVMALSGVEAALDEAARLLAAARQAGRSRLPHPARRRAKARPTTFASRSAPLPTRSRRPPGEPVIVKSYPNSFVGTDLEAQLKASGRTQLVIAGFMTHMCVNSTTRGALQPRLCADRGRRRHGKPATCRVRTARRSPPPRYSRPAWPPWPTCLPSSRQAPPT
jgi:hypothetical protein